MRNTGNSTCRASGPVRPAHQTRRAAHERGGCSPALARRAASFAPTADCFDSTGGVKTPERRQPAAQPPKQDPALCPSPRHRLQATNQGQRSPGPTERPVRRRRPAATAPRPGRRRVRPPPAVQCRCALQPSAAARCRRRRAPPRATETLRAPGCPTCRGRI